MKGRFQLVPERCEYAREEESTLAEWKRKDTFQESVRRTEGLPEYSFYDGPPFATGLPHYGHLLAGTIKDTVTRYASQTGHKVVRRFGWDTHGLPVEFEIDKKLGIKGHGDVLKLGIKNYNAECRNIVQRYATEWEEIVSRMGRWIDFENDYKTLDITFMESVWWVFGTIFAKGLVYKGFKVMPYSTACTTPLSNFEAGQNYKDVQDPAVVVSFPLVDDKDVALLAWTTTPWTLPSNLALCVHPDMEYVKIKDVASGKLYILMKARLSILYKEAANDKPKYEILETMMGKDLKDTKYVPLFDYFSSYTRERGAHRVLVDEYVTSDSGTGIVHQAPAFGEDDYRVCMAAGIIDAKSVPCPVDLNGCFTNEVPDFVGQHVKAADGDIMKHLKAMGRMVNQSTIFHSYPFCWRSDTPLIYKTVPSWFVDVPALKKKLLANNDKTHWVPAFVKEKRFANWLSDAREWCISRNRFWGTPVPIWSSDDGEEVCVISSIAQLEELTGTKVNDLHRDSIDHLTIPSKMGKGVLRRVDEVFDCWFESGSMPYAQKHYPFENKESFEQDYFPADFIAEGLDQTRGWFYTLLVISTALFDKPPFKNLIVNGLVLAADGKKMSKSKKNYPDPKVEIIDQYGADALRLYLINSPVVRAEPLKFVKEGVFEVLKEVFNPWYNAYRFFINYANRLESEDGVPFVPNYGKPVNVMDKWILSAAQSLVEYVRIEMEAYRLYTVVPILVNFVELLTNWYVRLNRPRLKGQVSLEDARMSLSVLFEILYLMCRTMGPFTPFLVEMMYRNLRNGLPESEREDSVHFLRFPSPRPDLVNLDIERAVKRMQTVIALGRVVRERLAKPTKYPMKCMVVVHADPEYLRDLEGLKSYVHEELNIKDLVMTSDSSQYVTLRAEAIGKSLGPRIGKDLRAVTQAVAGLTHDQCLAFKDSKSIKVLKHTLGPEDIRLIFEQKPGTSWESNTDDDVIILLDTAEDDSLLSEGMAREVLNRIQRLRKKAGLEIHHECNVFFEGDEVITRALSENSQTFLSVLKRVPHPANLHDAAFVPCFTEETAEVEGHPLTLKMAWPTVVFHGPSLNKLKLGEQVHDLKKAVYEMDYNRLVQEHAGKGGKVKVPVGGKKVDLTIGKHVFLTVEDLLQA